MKKLFAIVAAALFSVAMFASREVVPSDADLASYATKTYTMCIYNADACNEIVLIGTYVNWNAAADLEKFQAVEGFEGWYVATWDDETGAEAKDGGVQAKPVQLDGSGNFRWDYQLGPDAELLRGTADLIPGNNGTEVDIKNIGAGIVVIDVKSWKNNPCTLVYHVYNITLVSPDCNPEDYVVPAISGDFNNWAQQAMEMNELATAERQQAGLPGAVFEVSFKAAVGSGFQFRSSEEWGADWSNLLKEYDEEVGEWAAFNGGANILLGEETNIEYDLGDPEKYSWDYCGLSCIITKIANNGSISGPSQANYLDEITLTAIPNDGYHFTQWSDGLTDNPRTFVLTQDTTFTAEFAIDRTGHCGNDSLLTWTYNPVDKTLTISGEGAFEQNMQCGIEARTELENLVFEDGVTAIGADAFKNLTTLQTLVLSKDVKKINENAFYNCENLEAIYNYRPTPTNVYSNTFDGVDKFECILYVPKASIELYQNASVWRDFYYTQALKYKVQFVDWDGTILSEQQVTEEESAVAPTDPVREGYTFIGWDKEFDNITADLIVTAQYTINRYKVDFVDWDATLLKTDSVEWHTAAVAPADPGRDWYTFTGWDKDFSVVVADLVVTALYKEGQSREYVVLFSKGTDDGEIAQDTISITFPAPPSISGFTFVRWEFKTTALDDVIEIQAIYEAENPSATPDVVSNPSNKAQKLIRQGNVYILTDDHTYTIQGQQIK